MTKSLTDIYIADSYKGVLHGQGQALSGTGQNCETTLIYDGEGLATSIAIGRKGAGMTVYCGLSTCGEIYVSGESLNYIIDKRDFWTYNATTDSISNKLSTFEQYPIDSVQISALSAYSLSASGFTYPTKTQYLSGGQVMMLASDGKTLQLVNATRSMFGLTKDRTIFCVANSNGTLPIDATQLNSSSAFSSDRISGDTLRVVGIKHGGTRRVISYISTTYQVVASTYVKYVVNRFTFDGSVWVLANTVEVPGEHLGISSMTA